MSNYYFSCGGICNGPVQVVAANLSEAQLLAGVECNCDGASGCTFLGCNGVNCAGNTDLTEEQRAFVPSTEFLATARKIHDEK